MSLEVKEVVANDHHEFLRTIIDLQSIYPFRNIQTRPIFRGLGNSTKYELIPTAFREHEQEKFWELAHVSNMELSKEQRSNPRNNVMGEVEIIRNFYQISDSSGLSLPPINSEIAAFLEVPMVTSMLDNSLNSNMIVDNWPPKSVTPIIALAQHYGLPTRLLDWSYDPFIASYFAAYSGYQNNPNSIDNDIDIAIWVMNSSLIYDLKILENFPARIDLVTPPYYQNPNLSAQKGVFTVISDRDCDKDDFSKAPLDKTIISYMNNGLMESKLGPIYKKKNIQPFAKILLKQCQSANLLKSLNSMGYNPARIFPGYQGVTNTVQLLGELQKKSL